MQPQPSTRSLVAIHQLHHQAVRDLAWCCLSAPLLHELPGSDAHMLPPENGDLWQWLTALDQQPAVLLSELKQLKSTRLGIYYEALWRFYFSHSPKWELMAHNLQINRGKTTLGAFDFLCRYGDEYWHIETAVKFYLCNNNDRDAAKNWSNWIGPGSNDRLDLKLLRLRDHQLPLHKTPEGQAELNQRFPQVTHWKSGLCLQGYLFSPAPRHLGYKDFFKEDSTQYFYHPNHSNQNQGVGYWWRLEDFLALIMQPDSLTQKISWIILQRQQWLAPVHVSSNKLPINTMELIAAIEQQMVETKRPLLLAAVKEHNLDSDIPNKRYEWQETLRAFVVPNNWPDSNHYN